MPWTCTYWCFSWKNVFGPPQKTMVVDKKKKNVLPLLRTQALCYKAICANRVRTPTTKMNSSKANFVTWTFCLPPKLLLLKRHLNILLKFFFPFIDIWYFSQVVNFTSVELNRFAKEPSFFENSISNATVIMRFPAKKLKDDILAPCRVVLGLLPPSPESVRVDGLARRWTSRPKFLGSIGYQICLAKVLRWRTAIRQSSKLKFKH